jgi:lipid A ethanolaminephosphotransferase
MTAGTATSHTSFVSGLAAASRPAIRVETLALLTSIFLSLACNRAAWQHVLEDRAWGDPATWWFAAGAFVALTAFQFIVIALVLTRRNARYVVAALLTISAVAGHFIQTYNVYLDPGMLRSVLHTDVREASELKSASLLLQLAWQAVLPSWLVWRQPLVDRPWRRALLARVVAIAAAVVMLLLALAANFQDFAGIARNHREWRYLVTPTNVLYSAARASGEKAKAASAPLQPIGMDAVQGPSWSARTKPSLLVVVVGETARAANWGLDGYARQTTPELAALDVVNFSDVTTCGTDTEASVPCMFRPWGLRQHDSARERSHESLLHVLQRAHLPVLWRDNQSGCKGVCTGLELDQLDTAKVDGLCEDGRCFDEILLHDLDRRLEGKQGPQVLVLHGLGSHGPAYYRRYPEQFRRFTPTCDTAELRKCSPEQIVNSYDNTLLYTDHVLAATIRWMQSHAKERDGALIYVSDHGESLGEHNLYLHGMPRAIAPTEQTHVPMVMWLSQGFASSFGIDTGCLRRRAAQAASHDNLFHTVLGMMDVHTSIYEQDFDLTGGCRSSHGAAPQP